MRKIHSLIFTVLLFLSSILPTTSVFADANNFYFKDLTIDYNLYKSTEGSSIMEVTETFTAEFPNYNQNHGIERIIPFLNQNDTNLTMESADTLIIGVTRNGNSEPYTIKTNDTNFVVRIGSPNEYVKGEQVYTLKYKFINVITSFEDSTYSTDPYQELYWDTNGTDWYQRFNNVTVNLHMSEDVKNSLISDREISYTSSYKTKTTIHENNKTSNKLAAWCYVGVRGASNQERCEINDIEDGIQYKASGLGSGENMTIVTNFNDNTFVVPKNDFVTKQNYKDIRVDYYLSRDENGTARLKVKEDFTALFPTLNEVRTFQREIPFVNGEKIRFITEDQNNLDIKVTMDGKVIEPDYILPGSDGYFSVAVSGDEKYLHGEHNFTFEYELKDVIELATDKKTGNTVQFLSASIYNEKFIAYDISNLKMTIHIDKDLITEIVNNKYIDELEDEYELKTFCEDGTTHGYKNRKCVINENEDGYTYSISDITSANRLAANINFKDGTFKIGEPNRNYLYWHIFGIFILVAGVIVFISISKNYKKVAEKIKYLKGLPVVPQYTPIKDITVAEIGKNYLRPTRNLKVATMLELIVNKKLELRRESQSGLFKNKYKWFAKVIDDSHLSTEQQDLIVILKNGIQSEKLMDGKEFEITHHSYSSSLENAFNDYDRHIIRALKNDNMLENDDEKIKKKKTGIEYDLFTKHFRNIGIFFCVVFGFYIISGFIAGLFESYQENTNFTTFSIYEGAFLVPVMIVIALIIAAGVPILSIVSEKYKIRTIHGLEISHYTDGLKMYIKMAESERIKFLQSVEGVDTSEEGIVKLHEKLLPYAALFGLEKSWMKELEKYYELEKVETPTWYGSDFSFVALNSIMHSTMSRPIDTSSSSGWSSGGSSGGFSSSSGSSGGGGGGYSGGGGGGGGGGGW